MTQLDHKESLRHEAWRVFRIMSEFVDAFETLAKVGPAVSMFGSARTLPRHTISAAAQRMTRKVADSQDSGQIRSRWAGPAGVLEKIVGGRPNRLANCRCSLCETFSIAPVRHTTTAQPPKPPPVIRAPITPPWARNSAAASTSVSSSEQLTS